MSFRFSPRLPNRAVGENVEREVWRQTDFVVFYTCYTVVGNDSPFAISAYPEVRMNFFRWDDLAFQNVTHEQVVVHCLCYNFRDCEGIEFEESVMLRSAGLNGRACQKKRLYKTVMHAFLLRERRRRVTSPNWEK
jgi:hypothetical protein